MNDPAALFAAMTECMIACRDAGMHDAAAAIERATQEAARMFAMMPAEEAAPAPRLVVPEEA